MKIRFVNILFFLFVAFIRTASAVQTTFAVPGDYFDKVDLSAAQLVKLTINDEVTRKSVKEFEEFQQSRQEIRHQISDFSIIKSYILEVLKLDHEAYCQIESWISKPIEISMPQKRSLSLSLESLAGLLSIKTPKPILASELNDYLVDAQKQSEASTQFGILCYFGTKILQIPHTELSGLSAWIQPDNHAVHMTADSPKLLKCDFGLVLDIFKSRAGRDIRKEFDQFAQEYHEKESRVHLRQDLEAYFMRSEPPEPMPMSLTMNTVNESLWTDGKESFHIAQPKEFDVSMLLAEKKHKSLSGLFSNMDDRFRVFKRFIICRQINPVVEVAHPDLKAATLATFENGRIYVDGTLLNTTNSIWALSPYGEFCILPQSKSDQLGSGAGHHSYFFQKDQIGIPLACGGHIDAKDGKITTINNHSGHYGFVVLQLYLAISYFHQMDILDESLTVTDYLGTPKPFKDILAITKMIQFNK